MARLPRLVVPGQLHHLIARGNNDQLVFRDDSDYRAFHGWLREAAQQAQAAGQTASGVAPLGMGGADGLQHPASAPG